MILLACRHPTLLFEHMDGSDIQSIVERARVLNPDLHRLGQMPFTKIFIDISGQVRLLS
jgi:hypothetical protein